VCALYAAFMTNSQMVIEYMKSVGPESLATSIITASYTLLGNVALCSGLVLLILAIPAIRAAWNLHKYEVRMRLPIEEGVFNNELARLCSNICASTTVVNLCIERWETYRKRQELGFIHKDSWHDSIQDNLSRARRECSEELAAVAMLIEISTQAGSSFDLSKEINRLQNNNIPLYDRLFAITKQRPSHLKERIKVAGDYIREHDLCIKNVVAALDDRLATYLKDRLVA